MALITTSQVNSRSVLCGGEVVSKFEMEENNMSLDVCVYYHVHTYIIYVRTCIHKVETAVMDWSGPTMKLLVWITLCTLFVYSHLTYYNQ